MGFFDRFKKSDGGAASANAASGQHPAQTGDEHNRDPRKARRFFDHARTSADTGNHDYAIECYINGLKFDPDSLKPHEELRDVAMRRKVAGGKPAAMMEKLKHQGGKTAVEKMLNAEYLWSKDPLDLSLAVAAMEGAVKAECGEVAYWMGELVLSQPGKKDKKLYLKLKDLFSELGAFDKAVDAFRFVIAADPGNMQLIQEMKNLEAEKTIQQARFAEKGDFRNSIRNADEQAALQQEQSLSQQEAAVEATIQRARQSYADAPEDVDKLQKLVRALLQKEEDATENEAITLLKEAFDRTGQYRFKMAVGDVKMKQYKRHARGVKQEIAASKDAAAVTALQQKLKLMDEEQIRFELAEFTERAKNYPTDMRLRHELGLRQFALGDNDAAIGSFQEAQADPKVRSVALRYLGAAFLRKEWADEAVDTFRRGIEVHPIPDDKIGLELRYELSRALELKARKERSLPIATEALKIASNIAQADINYKDIRQVVDRLRKLCDELRAAA